MNQREPPPGPYAGERGALSRSIGGNGKNGKRNGKKTPPPELASLVGSAVDGSSPDASRSVSGARVGAEYVALVVVVGTYASYG